MQCIKRPLTSWRQDSWNHQSWWWLIPWRSYTSNQMLSILLLVLCYPWNIMMTSGTHVLIYQRAWTMLNETMMPTTRKCSESWEHYLEGAKVQFEIWNDHRNLQYFMEAKKLNRWQACWALYLSRLNFKMVHKLGPTMRKADALLRHPDYKEGIEHNNEDVILLKPEYFKIHTLRQGHLLIEGHEESILAKIRKSKDLDESVINAVEELKKSSIRQLWSEKWSEEQGLMLSRGKVYVLKDIKLRLEIIKLHYNTPVAGHPGQWKTLELVTYNYWWPGITMQVKNYVLGCNQCQWMKSFPEKPAEKLKPNSQLSSWRSWMRSWGSKLSYQQHITHRLMDRQNRLIRKLNNI